MMPAISLTVTGIEDAIRRAETLEALYKTRIAAVLREWGEEVAAKMREGHPPGGPHPPPGVMPVYGEHAYIDRTGRLTRSIGYTVEAWSQRSIRLHVFALAPYAEAVEVGTPHARPYPFFWPVIYEKLPLLYERLAAAVAVAFEEMGEYGHA